MNVIVKALSNVQKGPISTAVGIAVIGAGVWHGLQTHNWNLELIGVGVGLLVCPDSLTPKPPPKPPES